MKKQLITRILAGVATLTIAGSMAFASPASAEPNGSGSAPKKGCVDPDGGSKDLPDGTVWTSKDQSGHIASQYKCNDGNWDKVDPPKAVNPGGGSHRINPGGVRTAQAATR